ncbi:Increased DNA methylation 1 [Linum perenne]
MEERRRSGEPAGYVVKNKGPSGCLIVKKKATDGVGSSASRKVVESKQKKKRPRLDFSDSGSSDELLMPPHRRLAPATLRNSNGASDFDMSSEEDSGIGRKRSRGDVSMRGEMDGIDRDMDNFIDRTRLDVFDFNEYEGTEADMRRIKRPGNGAIDNRRLFGSMAAGRSSLERGEYDSGSSRDAFHEKKRGSYFERASGSARGDRAAREGVRLPVPAVRDNYDSDKPIRVQGKNGVLKVMVNKKKKVGESFNGYNSPLEPEKTTKGVRTEESVKKNVPLHPSYYSGSKKVAKAIPFVGREKKLTNMLNSVKSAAVADDDASDHDSDDSDALLTKKPKMRAKHIEPRNLQKTPVSTKISKSADMNSDDSDTSLKQGPRSAATVKSTKRTGDGVDRSTPKQLPASKSNEGKAKRGSGTEKQKLREKIRGMLIDAGWTIDYRPRRNRDYLDAVYINPAGTAYWSIIKAYEALLKQQKEDEDDAKAKAAASSLFTPLSDDLLSQLTRNTRKKMEKEMRKKQRDSRKSENARETMGRKASSSRYEEESMDSHSHEEKLSSFIKQGGKSLKGSSYYNSSASVTSKGQKSMNNLHENNENLSSGYNSHHGRKSKKLGRCTLLVRKSNQDLNSDGDGFVPYTGKRTLLSWLVDRGAVQLSQKVRYMNKRRTKVLLEGWVTRDGIHCGCCSKILTVSKFEIHAGSKLRQPFQNIYLDSGVSLLDCQIDAWNRQEAAENIGFHSVDVGGDDPNDDTCPLCGDGGDLICCDGCPSTFHQSCLDIEMLPPGDWHCPNCTCKFCRSASDDVVDEDDPTVSALPTCSLCARKYHESCMKDLDAATVEGDSSKSCFCSGTCCELYEQLLKYVGVKHELEAGFSWSIIRRMDFDLDTSLQGIPQRVEGNSKLAVALSVMDECFLPIIDRRSGINLLHGVLYNCGSNFNRLNYSGFFTVILEKGDEIISAASVRLHGTELAEMPFIGTRHIYRRQGMCKRLFCAVELALRSLKVERLIIPAISELMHTWTEVFGFTKLDESLEQELKSMNTLVFPGVDMLQKQLLGQDNVEKRNISKGEKEKEYLGGKCGTATKQSDSDSSAGHDRHESDNGGPGQNSEGKIGPASTKSDSLLPDASINGGSTNSSLDASGERKQTVNSDSGFVDKLDKSGTHKENLAVCHTTSCEPDINARATQNCSGEDISSHAALGNQFLEVPSDDVSGMSGSIDASRAHKHPVDCEAVELVDTDGAALVDESTSAANHLTTPVMSTRREIEEEHDLEGNSNSCKDGYTDHVQALDLSESTSEGFKGSFSTEQTKSGGFRKEDKVPDVTSEIKCSPSYMMSNHCDEMEVYPPLDDDTQLYKEVDLGTTAIDMAGMEGEGMPVEIFAGKMHPISPEPTKVDSQKHCAYEAGSGPVSEAINSAASFLHKPEHGSETDASEGETESE